MTCFRLLLTRVLLAICCLPQGLSPRGRREPEGFRSRDWSRGMSVRSKHNRVVEAPTEPEHDGSELPEGSTNTELRDVASMRLG